jgi:pimeloyl-ACP methyl ester carboxylesterase
VTFTARIVQTSVGPVEAAVAGSGPAVVLVHGMPGDWRQTLPIGRPLVEDSTVVLLSRPGYGATPLRTGRTIDAQARAMGALLDELAIERATFVGVSGGGPSSAAFSRLFPDRTSGLVLVSAVCPDILDLPAVARRIASVPGIWESLSVPHRAIEERKLRRGFDELRDLTEPEVEAVLARPQARADLRTFVTERPSVLRGPGLRNDVVQCWSTRRQPVPTWATPPPTVVLHGDVDVVVPVAHAHEHARRISGARLEIYPGWGHALPLVAADRVAAATRALAHA